MDTIQREGLVLNPSKFPVNFPVNGNFAHRDGFAADCILRQLIMPIIDRVLSFPPKSADF